MDHHQQHLRLQHHQEILISSTDPTIHHYVHAELEAQLPRIYIEQFKRFNKGFCFGSTDAVTLHQLKLTSHQTIFFREGEEVEVGIYWQMDGYLVHLVLDRSSADAHILPDDSIPFLYTLILVGKVAGLRTDKGNQVGGGGEEADSVTEAIALQLMEVKIYGMVLYLALQI
jgi:hypothetical protein